MDKNEIKRLLHAKTNVKGHITGAAVGSGLTAKYTAEGGVDFLLTLSAGKYRIMGKSSFASYLPYGNSNDITMELGTREILPLGKDIPVLFGLNATDPGIHLYEYLKEIKRQGFSGIVNYPTVCLLDGKFREAVEEEGATFDREVEAIHLSNHLDMFTIAFVTTEEETVKMLDAGADIICVHLGLTKGGALGAKKAMPINTARRHSDELFEICEKKRPEVIRMIYAGPASTPVDMQFLYKNTRCQGYIGGSTFERIPAERAILNTTKAFTGTGSFDRNDPMSKMVNGEINPSEYVPFVKMYIEEHYMDEISLTDLALVAHVNSSYLSTKFKNETGISFTEYLVRFRINKAKEYFESTTENCREVSEAVGYVNYEQFSRIFKKYTGKSPAVYRKEAAFEHHSMISDAKPNV